MQSSTDHSMAEFMGSLFELFPPPPSLPFSLSFPFSLYQSQSLTLSLSFSFSHSPYFIPSLFINFPPSLRHSSTIMKKKRKREKQKKNGNDLHFLSLFAPFPPASTASPPPSLDLRFHTCREMGGGQWESVENDDHKKAITITYHSQLSPMIILWRERKKKTMKIFFCPKLLFFPGIVER